MSEFEPPQFNGPDNEEAIRKQLEALKEKEEKFFKTPRGERNMVDLDMLMIEKREALKKLDQIKIDREEIEHLEKRLKEDEQALSVDDAFLKKSSEILRKLKL